MSGDRSNNSSPLRSETPNGEPTPQKDSNEEQEDPANKDFRKRFKADLFAGHVPTKVDDQQKAQMMGFIAYAQNINESVKLLCMSKLVALVHSSHDKNRIFVTGNAMMSTKLSSSKQAIEKAITQLHEHPIINVPHLRRCQLLDRQERHVRNEKSVSTNYLHGPHVTQMTLQQNPNLQVGPANNAGGMGRRTMREALEVLHELTAKYIDLSDYRKNSCLDINKCLPMKESHIDDDDDANATDITKSTLGNQIAKIKRDADQDELDPKELKRIKTLKKRRKLQHSFMCAANLRPWEENVKHKDYCEIKPGAQFWFKSALQDFDQRDRRAINIFIKKYVKPEQEMMQLGISKSRSLIGGGPMSNGKNIIHGPNGQGMKLSFNNVLGITDEVEMYGNNPNGMYQGD